MHDLVGGHHLLSLCGGVRSAGLGIHLRSLVPLSSNWADNDIYKRGDALRYQQNDEPV